MTKQVEFVIWRTKADHFERFVDFSTPQPNVYESDNTTFRMTWNYTVENVEELLLAKNYLQPYANQVWMVDLEKKPSILQYIVTDDESISATWVYCPMLPVNQDPTVV